MITLARKPGKKFRVISAREAKGEGPAPVSKRIHFDERKVHLSLIDRLSDSKSKKNEQAEELEPALERA